MIIYTLFALVYLSTLVIFGLVIHHMHRSHQGDREALQYAEIRLDDAPIGNMEHYESLLKSVHTLNRRVARLIESPKLYLRTRRVIGVLDLPAEELTAELDIIHLAETQERELVLA